MRRPLPRGGVTRGAWREWLLVALLWVGGTPLAMAETASGAASLSVFEQAERAEALGQWLEARAAYAGALKVSDGDPGHEVEALLGLARSERALGEVPASVEHLKRALSEVSAPGQASRLPAVEASLGASELALGHAGAAEKWFGQALEGAEARSDFALIATVENDWGILEALQGHSEAAVAHFEASVTAAAKANLPSLEVRALGNAARSLSETESRRSAELRRRAAGQLASLPLSQTQAGLWVNLGDQESRQKPLLPEARVRAARWLYAGLKAADQLGNEAVAAQALSGLSGLYRSENRTSEALSLADRAVTRGRAAGQMGEIYKLEVARAQLLQEIGRTQEAILAYGRAIEALEPLRHQSAWAGALNPSTF